MISLTNNCYMNTLYETETISVLESSGKRCFPETLSRGNHYLKVFMLRLLS